MVDTDDKRCTPDDERRTTPQVWHKLPTGELKITNRLQIRLYNIRSMKDMWHTDLAFIFIMKTFTKYWLLLREIPWDIRCEVIGISPEGPRVISPHRTPDISGYLQKLSSQYLGYYTPFLKSMISYVLVIYLQLGN